jgi:hypothetical protein
MGRKLRRSDREISHSRLKLFRYCRYDLLLTPWPNTRLSCIGGGNRGEEDIELALQSTPRKLTVTDWLSH